MKEPLSIVFPCFFALTAYKEALVADIWESSGEEGGCSLVSIDLSMIGN